MPVLADCGEPLAEGVVDMRGLWLAYTGRIAKVIFELPKRVSKRDRKEEAEREARATMARQ